MERAGTARRDRREGRPGLRIRVRLRSPGEVLWKLGDTLNRGWLLAPTQARAPLGCPVDVEFDLPAPASPIHTKGEIIGVAPGFDGSALVRFANLTATAKAEIDRLINSYRHSPPNEAGASPRRAPRTSRKTLRGAAHRAGRAAG